jgi:hypothetical protein
MDVVPKTYSREYGAPRIVQTLPWVMTLGEQIGESLSLLDAVDFPLIIERSPRNTTRALLRSGPDPLLSARSRCGEHAIWRGQARSRAWGEAFDEKQRRTRRSLSSSRRRIGSLPEPMTQTLAE